MHRLRRTTVAVIKQPQAKPHLQWLPLCN
jgi:hypothetical protein